MALGAAAMTYVVFAPLFTTPEKEPDAQAKLPAYDYRAWDGLPVKEGRTKPFHHSRGRPRTEVRAPSARRG